MDRLSQDNGHIVRTVTSYDRLFAIDHELLFQFLNGTQPDEMAVSAKSTKPVLSQFYQFRGHESARQPAGCAEARR